MMIMNPKRKLPLRMTSSEDDFFSETEKSESERPAPSADDVADTIEDADEDDDPYESDSDKE